MSHVWVEIASNFATHLPVSIRIQGARSLGLGRRMTQPKVHSVDKPETVRPAGIRIDWEHWLKTEPGGDHVDYAEVEDGEFDNLVSQWYSGAELELNGVFGHVGQESETDYMGIGQMSRVVECALGNRRRGASDDAGLIGHRLSWTARGIHLVIRWAFNFSGEGQIAEIRPDMKRLIKSFGYRATAIMREKVVCDPPEDERAAAETLHKALRLLGSLVRAQHRQPALLDAGQ